MTVGRVDAVLLDRDGTINAKAAEGEYIVSPAQVEVLPGAAEAIRLLNRQRVPVVVVTNQRGIARGRMTEGDLTAVHNRLSALLALEDAHIDAFFHCPHERDTCDCRKPGTLMLRRAQTSLGLPCLCNSIMIGDSPHDVDAGLRAGAQTILLGSGEGVTVHERRRAHSLLDAVRMILGA